ncbi:hypothetical protein C1752_13979 [Acaryochloris thomasi RCC1774]|uniref:Uncharacterized protein n=1 Tax=Acaryochloris thomasi RCC1774 TaxID=1764569 RepID=A0A2W1J863_9CYAN|nr:hypothetical protein [Acaryochloris thomasi]PZD70346.1 hypothetical protein C1752_13979 [Acaryochloris thomasi RCC1774]
MLFFVFSVVLWLSVLANQLLVIFPLKLLQAFALPPMLGSLVLLGIFAWIFGD